MNTVSIMKDLMWRFPTVLLTMLNFFRECKT